MTLKEEIYSKINHLKKFTHSRQQGIALEQVANTIGCFECLDTKLVVEKGTIVKYSIYNCDSCSDSKLATQTNSIVLKRKGITLFRKNDHSDRAIEDRLKQLLVINDNLQTIDICEGFQLEEPVVAAEVIPVEPIIESIVEQSLVESIVEQPVESLVEEVFEQSVEPLVESIVEQPVESIVEEVFEQSVEPLVESIVEQPVESIVEQPVESIVEAVVECEVNEPEEESIVEENNELIEEHTETIVNETSKPNKKKNKRKSIQL